jgi:hypothetical protein
MANLPVFHELCTAVSSLGHAVTGNTQSARDVWKGYAEKSVVGSICYALHEKRNGNNKRARELMKNCGEATAGACAEGLLIAAQAMTATGAVTANPLGIVAGAIARRAVGTIKNGDTAAFVDAAIEGRLFDLKPREMVGAIRAVAKIGHKATQAQAAQPPSEKPDLCKGKRHCGDITATEPVAKKARVGKQELKQKPVKKPRVTNALKVASDIKGALSKLRQEYHAAEKAGQHGIGAKLRAEAAKLIRSECKGHA